MNTSARHLAWVLIVVAGLTSATAQTSQTEIRWTAIGPGAGGTNVCATVHPLIPDSAFICSDVGGIYRTLDGGITWTNSNVGLAEADVMSNVYNIESYLFHPVNPRIIYAGAGEGIFKTVDLGDSWALTFPHPGTGASAMDPSDPDVFYFGTGHPSQNVDSSPGRLIKCTGGGQQCVAINYHGSPPPAPVIHSILVNPADSDHISLSTDQGIFESFDGGTNWSIRVTDLPHDDLREMERDPQSGALYVVLDPPEDADPVSFEWGVYKSVNGGSTWAAAHGVDGANEFLNADFEQAGGPGPALGWLYYPNSSAVPHVTLSDEENHTPGGGGSLKVETPTLTYQGSNGVITDRFAVEAGDRFEIGGWSKVVPTGATNITFFSRIKFYDDAGSPVQVPCSTSPHINVLVSRETNPDWKRFKRAIVIPAGVTQAEVAFYTSSTESTTYVDDVYMRISRSLPSTAGTNPAVLIKYRTLAVDPFDPDTVYVGTTREESGDRSTSGVWKTTDGGTTWAHTTRSEFDDNVADGRFPTGCDSREYDIWGLGVGSGSTGHDVLYITTGAGVLTSGNGAISWEEVSSNSAGDGSWSTRGETNNVITWAVTEDPTDSDRLYYGDADNRLVVSLNGGQSFILEGLPAWSDAGVTGDSATSVVVVDPSRVVVGVYSGDNSGTSTSQGGVVDGTFDGSSWTWEALAPESFPTGGGVQLVMDSGALFAGVYGKGVFRIDPPSPTATWSDVSGPDLASKPVYRMVTDGSGAIFAGLGNPRTRVPPPAADTGVWVTTNGGVDWSKISGAEMDHEPVLWIEPVGVGKLYVGTASALQLDEGGLYEGTESGGTWTWQRLLNQPRVTGVVVSPLDSEVLFAMSSQWSRPNPGQVAGLYKSVDGGTSWSRLNNNGLDHLRSGGLLYSMHDDFKLYLPTTGSGLFEATLLKPSAPEDLAGAALSSTSIRLDWVDTSNTEQGVRIERRKGTGPPRWNEIAVLGANQVTYIDNTVSKKKTYVYRIVAFNEVDESDYSHEATVTTP